MKFQLAQKRANLDSNTTTGQSACQAGSTPFLGALGVSAVNRRSAAVLIALLVFVTLDPELDQTVNQFAIRQSSRCPQFRIHADRGEAGHGVDLVDVDLARLWID